MASVRIGGNHKTSNKSGNGGVPKKKEHYQKQGTPRKDKRLGGRRVATARGDAVEHIKKVGTVTTENPNIVKNAIDSIKIGDARSLGPRGAPQYKLGVTYTTHGCDVRVQLNDGAITSYASALVSKALTRGLDPMYAYPAIQQISEVLKNQCVNSNPVVTDVPGYLQVVGTALSPHTVLHKGSAYKYTWDAASANISAPQEVSYGGPNSSTKINYGYITQTKSTYGLPLIQLQSSISDDQKKLAFSKFTETMSRGDSGTSRPLTDYERKLLLYDSSAFSGQTIVDGFAVGGQGGTISRLGSEASINFPVLGRFANVLPTYRDYNRACNINTEAGGGPMELALFTTQYRAIALQQIKKPVIKFIDALSLMHIYFMTWKLAIEQYCATSEFATLLVVSPNQAMELVQDRCIPLTFTQAMLVLRSEFMKSFSETQFAVQSLGPTTDTNESWAGFACGVGTCPNYQVASLMMSGPFAENLRALSSVTVFDVESIAVQKRFSTIKKTRHLTPEESEMERANKILRPFLPVLGTYIGQTLVESDYKVTVRGNEYYQLFRPEAVVNEKPPSSPMFGKPTKLKDDPQIRINDGFTTNGYLAINDSAILGEWINRMNVNFKKNDKFIAGSCENSGEPSANVLRQLGSNMFAVRNLQDDTNGAYLDTVKVIKQSYGYVPEKVVVEQFKFAMPLHYFSSTRDDSVLKSANDRETEILNLGTNGEYVKLRTELNAVALLGVTDGKISHVQERLDRISQNGGGGIFSDLAKAFNPLLTVGVGTIAGALDMIPM